MNNSGRKCIVPDCEVKKSKTTRFFRVPRDCYDKWSENFKIDKSTFNTRSRVCERHFKSDFIGRKRLKHGALPTENLGHNSTDIHLPTEQTPRIYTRKCRVPMCGSTSPPVFGFPKNEKKRKEWIEQCKFQKLSSLKSLNICSKHFETHMIGKTNKKLLSCAIPTLMLENNSKEDTVTDITENMEIDKMSINSEISLLENSSKDDTITDNTENTEIDKMYINSEISPSPTIEEPSHDSWLNAPEGLRRLATVNRQTKDCHFDNWYDKSSEPLIATTTATIEEPSRNNQLHAPEEHWSQATAQLQAKDCYPVSRPESGTMTTMGGVCGNCDKYWNLFYDYLKLNLNLKTQLEEKSNEIDKLQDEVLLKDAEIMRLKKCLENLKN